MTKHNKIGGLLAALMTLGVSSGNAVTVHINSGNPAFPFPQFLDYACGGNLGSHNPDGLTHIEMEMQIREAYQQHANEFEYTGEDLKGIKYIWTPYKAAYDCSEGDGYALLAAAYMGDKVTFDGYWMCTHDKRRVKTKKYIDGTDTEPNYEYNDFAITDNANTAADGDVDIALALYVAYKQWGEFMLDDEGNKVLDYSGSPISYKQEMINVIRGLVAMTTRHAGDNPMKVNTGIIGLDGYPRGGDTWTEQTGWASKKENYIKNAEGVLVYPEFEGGEKQHVDYVAPAYFREFHDLLISLGSELGASNGWEAEQFRRAEASSDWLIGDLIGKNKYSLPTAGWSEVSDDGTTTSYTNFNEGEDYRCPLRTISNYVWHGNPDYTWNPVSHQVKDGGNTYEYDAAIKLSKYMADPAHWNEDGGTKCYEKSDKIIPYTGSRMMGWQIDPITGLTLEPKYSSSLSMQKGAASFAAIGAQNYNLMGELYGNIYQVWDIRSKKDDGTVVPNYMSGWFRQLGLMALTGNFLAPSEMNAQPNMKIYRALKDSMSFCHVGDTVTYLLSYRNFGSVDAEDVTIVEKVPVGFAFISADNGGVYNAANHTVTWNIGTVAGLKSDASLEGAELDFTAPNLSKTIGKVSYQCRPKAGASGKYKTTAKISCKGCKAVETNEFPNYETATMQRNSIDVTPTAISVTKSANVEKLVTNDTVKFNVAYANDTIPWLTGGRTRVNMAVAAEDKGNQYNIMTKLYNDADEPYIDNGNYRITFFKDMKGATGLQCSFDLLEGTQNGATMASNASEFKFNDYKLSDGTHKFTVQFPHALSTSTLYLNEMAGASGFTCKGVKYPLRVVMRFYDSSWGSVDFASGWSKIDKDSDTGFYYPITPSYQDQTQIKSIDKLLESACDIVDKVNETVLVEEFDGYTWRKVLGNSPEQNGHVAKNVVVTDTIPLGFEFIGFTDASTKATYKAASASDNYAGLITYPLGTVNIGDKGEFGYTCRFTGSTEANIITSSAIKDDIEQSSSAELVLPVDGNNSAVKTLSADNENSLVDVYTPSGIVLKRQVKAINALDGLAPGIYIVGDKKEIVFKK